MEEAMRIPRHLDDPPMLFFWHVDTVFLVILFFILGTLMGVTVYATLAGIVLARLWGQIDDRDHRGLLLSLSYWYGPFWLSDRPPSWVREYLG